MVSSSFPRTRTDCRNESNVNACRQKNCDCSSTDGVRSFCDTVSEIMGCFIAIGSCQEARPSLSDADIQGSLRNGTNMRFAGNTFNKMYQNVENSDCE